MVSIKSCQVFRGSFRLLESTDTLHSRRRNLEIVLAGNRSHCGWRIRSFVQLLHSRPVASRRKSQDLKASLCEELSVMGLNELSPALEGWLDAMVGARLLRRLKVKRYPSIHFITTAYNRVPNETIQLDSNPFPFPCPTYQPLSCLLKSRPRRDVIQPILHLSTSITPTKARCAIRDFSAARFAKFARPHFRIQNC